MAEGRTPVAERTRAERTRAARTPAGPPRPGGRATPGGPPAPAGRAAALRSAVERRLAHPLALPLGLLAAGAAGAAYLYDHDPHEGGHLLPRCPFNWTTGLLCPACGGTRMVYDLLHLDVAAAYRDNAALLLLGLPLAGYLWARRLREGLRGRRYRPQWGARGSAVLVGIAVVWAVARNLVG